MSQSGRLCVWREVLATAWLAPPVALAALAAAASHFAWELPWAASRLELRWAALFLALLSLLAAAIEGAQRAIARRERRVEQLCQEIERLVRAPQRRLVQAKYHLYRDAFMCSQLVGFLMMTRMEASAMSAETALGIERSWGSGFLERFERMFGAQRFGDVFSQRIGGMFPPPRDRAMSVYVGLADFLRLLAERITESDLDPDYLRGRDEAPEPASAPPDAPPAGSDPQRTGSATAAGPR